MTWLTCTEYLRQQLKRIRFFCRNNIPVFSPFMTYQRILTKVNTTDASSGAGTAHSYGALEFTLFFVYYDLCSPIFSFLCSLFYHCLPFVCCSLYPYLIKTNDITSDAMIPLDPV